MLFTTPEIKYLLFKYSILKKHALQVSILRILIYNKINQTFWEINVVKNNTYKNRRQRVNTDQQIYLLPEISEPIFKEEKLSRPEENNDNLETNAELVLLNNEVNPVDSNVESPIQVKKEYFYLAIGLAIVMIFIFISNTMVLMKNVGPVKIETQSVSALTNEEVSLAEKMATEAALNHLAIIYLDNDAQYQTSYNFLKENIAPQSPYLAFLTSPQKEYENKPSVIKVTSTQIFNLQQTLSKKQVVIKVQTNLKNTKYQLLTITLNYKDGNYTIYNIVSE